MGVSYSGAILIDCSEGYDYLVDEGTECNTTSDILLERNRELSIVDLLVPSLVLLITLLQKLQAKLEPKKVTLCLSGHQGEHAEA
ncbi:hypothetical protein CR513_04528, partial [Mucuna pruriens]